MTEAEAPIPCSVRGPQVVQLGESKSDFQCGCSIIDVLFPNVYFVEVGEIHLKNFYTAFLSVQVKYKEQGQNNEGKWKTCISKLQLMPDPHCDTGCEDYFVIRQKQLRFELRNISRLRFILRQPSPMWKEFKIEDICLYRNPIQATEESHLPYWIKNNLDADAESEASTEIKEIENVDVLSTHLQDMWAMTEEVLANQTQTSLGRYDVDGSYEINLLSYT